MLRRILLALLLLPSLGGHGIAQARNYVYSGTVSAVNSGMGSPSLWSSVQVGDPFTVTYQVDTSTTGTPVGPNQRDYFSSVLSCELHIGGVQASLGIASSKVQVLDNFQIGSACLDQFQNEVQPNSSDLVAVVTTLVSSVAVPNCPTAVTSLNLPTTLDLSSFQPPAAFAANLTTGGFILGSITSASSNADACADAIPVTKGSFVGVLTAASPDGQDGGCSCGVEPDVWYSFTAPTAGVLDVDTCGSEALSDINTILSVHSGCPGDASNLLGCDNDLATCSKHDSRVVLVLNAGQTVYIRVGNFCTTIDSAFLLNVAFTPTLTDLCNGDGGDQLGCTDCPCLNNATAGTIGGCGNSAGSSARLIASGDTSVSLPSGSSSDLRFALTGAPATAFCLLNSGDALAPTSLGNPCFGLDSGAQSAVFDGLRCAVMNTRRHGGRAADSNGEVGVTNAPWGGEGSPAAGLAIAFGGFTAGQTRYFQVIHRDDPLLGCMRGLNTSQAVRVAFAP